MKPKNHPILAWGDILSKTSTWPTQTTASPSGPYKGPDVVKDFVKTYHIKYVIHPKYQTYQTFIMTFVTLIHVPWMYSLILGTIPADRTLFHILFEATCHPPLRKWTNLTKPHQPGFGAILLQPSPSRFWATPQNAGLKRSKKGGGKKKTWVLFCFPNFQVDSNLSLHREPPKSGEEKKKASGGLLSSHVLDSLPYPSNPFQSNWPIFFPVKFLVAWRIQMIIRIHVV